MGAREIPTATDVHIGKRLRLRRMMIGLSQEEVAQAVGVAFQQIQKYECAVNRVSTSRLWDLSVALRCAAGFFYEGLDRDPGRETDGSGLPPAPDDEPPADTGSPPDDVASRTETLKLLRAYYAIKHPDTRRRILELAASLAKTRDVADQSTG